ncbi:MAG TPA: hypothetical protein PKY95_06210, partial [candidate division Zixibacteria bacterium]|nr:hypothetical protein [candidate division Zixibacteria bacterium]
VIEFEQHPGEHLGCGTGGKNTTTDNISARHLLNIQRIARRRVSPCIGPEMMAAYLDETVDALALERRCAEMEAGAARPGDPAGEPPKKT